MIDNIEYISTELNNNLYKAILDCRGTEMRIGIWSRCVHIQDLLNEFSVIYEIESLNLDYLQDSYKDFLKSQKNKAMISDRANLGENLKKSLEENRMLKSFCRSPLGTILTYKSLEENGECIDDKDLKDLVAKYISILKDNVKCLGDVKIDFEDKYLQEFYENITGLI